MTAQVRLADPETEGKLAANREKLAELESENVRLKAENVQVKTDNVRLKNEQIRLENELKSFRESNSVLRKELLETLNKYSSLTDRLRRMELSTAGIVETLYPTYLGSRERDLADTLLQTLKSGNALLVKSAFLEELIRNHFDELKLNGVDAAKVRVNLDDYRKAAGRFAMFNQPAVAPGKFNECRIMEINDALRVVILSAGARNGVRVGMILQGGENDGMVFRVAAVRPFASAAVLENGEITKLAVGMPVHTGSNGSIGNSTQH